MIDPVERFADRPACACEHTRIVQRNRTDGILIYVRQCQRCGRNCGAVSKKAADVLRLNDIPLWNDALQEQWRGAMRQYYQDRWARDEAERAQQNQEWWQRYTAYLATDRWHQKRAMVMQRANGLCEGCRMRPATQVHHLTYDHMGDELLFELVAICGVCHRKLHPHMDDV